MSDFEKHLISVMRQYGYECTVYATKVKLRQLPIGRWSLGLDLPWAFKSVFQAAEHLIPIIRDETYCRALEYEKEA